MRFRATEESLLAGEFSILAIAETLGAMALALWIGLSWSNYMHIAIGAGIAPLLLLRTDFSCIYTIAWFCANLYQQFQRILDKPFGYGRGESPDIAALRRPLRIVAIVMGLTVYHFAWPIGLVVARVVGGVVGVVRNFKLSVKAIPSNWRENVFSIDSGLMPCVLPEPRAPDSRKLFRKEGSPFLMKQWVGPPSVKEPTAVDLIGKPLALYTKTLEVASDVLTIVIPFLYRLSLKSTAIVWFPLLWWIHAFKEDDTPLKTRLEYQLGSDMFWLIRIASILAISGFCAKLALHAWWSGFAEWWNSNSFLQSVSIIVQPTVIPRWQIVIVVNALIAIGLWLYIRNRVWRLTCGIDIAKSKVIVVMSYALFARRLLSSYTILCVFYLFARKAFALHWPSLGDKWFPWQ